MRRRKCCRGAGRAGSVKRELILGGISAILASLAVNLAMIYSSASPAKTPSSKQLTTSASTPSAQPINTSPTPSSAKHAIQTASNATPKHA